MSPRIVPVPGRRVDVVHFGRRDPAWVVRVDGRSGARHGEPYWGTGLVLDESDVP